MGPEEDRRAGAGRALKGGFDPKETALSGMFGAAALALPVVFHVFGLGSVFLPMYLPLMTLPFLVSPGPAASVAFVAPLLSAILTGMPPLYPPVAVAMSLELSVMAATASFVWKRRGLRHGEHAWGHGAVLAVLVPVLLLGRVFQFGLGWGMGLLLNLPPEFLSVGSLVATFPGLILLVVAVPFLVRRAHDASRHPPQSAGDRTDRIAFFDELATRWNGQVAANDVMPGIEAVLRTIALKPDERVLDLGCGTGRLTGALLDSLGAGGRVEAVDFSPSMIARARTDYPDPRGHFHVTDAADIPLPDASIDRILCFSAWPHFTDPDAVIHEALRLLKPDGSFHVWHAEGRSAIDALHRHAGDAVCHDHLEPAEALATRMTAAGFRVTETVDREDAYRVTAVKKGVHRA